MSPTMADPHSFQKRKSIELGMPVVVASFFGIVFAAGLSFVLCALIQRSRNNRRRRREEKTISWLDTPPVALAPVGSQPLEENEKVDRSVREKPRGVLIRPRAQPTYSKILLALDEEPVHPSSPTGTTDLKRREESIRAASFDVQLPTKPSKAATVETPTRSEPSPSFSPNPSTSPPQTPSRPRPPTRESQSGSRPMSHLSGPADTASVYSVASASTDTVMQHQSHINTTRHNGTPDPLSPELYSKSSRQGPHFVTPPLNLQKAGTSGSGSGLVKRPSLLGGKKKSMVISNPTNVRRVEGGPLIPPGLTQAGDGANPFSSNLVSLRSVGGRI